MNAKTMGILQTIAAVLIVLWWALFFAVWQHDPTNTAAYLAYESAFPLADLAWLMPLLVQAARANLRGSLHAAVWTAAAGGALVFLGVLDFSFNIQQGIYARSLTDGLLNGAVNALCIGFGLWSISWSKRQ